MKIFPCKKAEKLLSFDDIKKEEGIYRPDHMQDYRFIVLTDHFGSEPAMFWINVTSNDIGPVNGHEGTKFKKMSEKLCAELQSIE